MSEQPAGYYSQDRADLVAQLPRPLGRVLDVGCGEGGTAGPLREAGASWISGIELFAPAAERAAAVLDEVVAGRAEEGLSRVSSPFDTVLAYDVLEHLVDPAALLRALHGVTVPNARLHVSVPNARHWSLVRDLVVRGTFGYVDAGHRDRTHLRWFTKADLRDLLEDTGWRVQNVSHARLRAASRLVARLTRGFSAELLVYQISALARRSPNAESPERSQRIERSEP